MFSERLFLSSPFLSFVAHYYLIGTPSGLQGGKKRRIKSPVVARSWSDEWNCCCRAKSQSLLELVN
jgi:hypothetical protein